MKFVLLRLTGLKEPITNNHPQVKAAVKHALQYASVQPMFLEPNDYVDVIEKELNRLEYENRCIPLPKRK